MSITAVESILTDPSRNGITSIDQVKNHVVTIAADAKCVIVSTNSRKNTATGNTGWINTVTCGGQAVDERSTARDYSTDQRLEVFRFYDPPTGSQTINVTRYAGTAIRAITHIWQVRATGIVELVPSSEAGKTESTNGLISQDVGSSVPSGAVSFYTVGVYNGGTAWSQEGNSTELDDNEDPVLTAAGGYNDVDTGTVNLAASHAPSATRTAAINVFAIQPSAAVPGAITDLDVEASGRPEAPAIGSDQVQRLTWTAAADADNHEVHMSTTEDFTPGPATLVTTMGPSAILYDVLAADGLTPQTLWYYKILATNAAGSTESNQASQTTPPPEPAAFTVTNNGDGTVDFNITSTAAPAVDHEVWGREKDVGSYGPIIDAHDSEYPWTYSGIGVGETWQFFAMSHDANGYSEATAIQEITLGADGEVIYDASVRFSLASEVVYPASVQFALRSQVSYPASVRFDNAKGEVIYPASVRFEIPDVRLGTQTGGLPLSTTRTKRQTNG